MQISLNFKPFKKDLVSIEPIQKIFDYISYVKMSSAVSSHSSEHHLLTKIVIAVIIVGCYVIGVALHSKIIKLSKKEKDLTWKIDITHSILVLVLYAYSIFIHSTTYLVDDLHKLTGEWFCYATKVVSQYQIIYIGGHSWIISMFKYVVIVHEERIRNYKDKIKMTFFYLNFLYPILSVFLIWCIIPDFFVVYGGFSHSNRCLGTQSKNYSKWISMCNLPQPIHDSSVQDAIYMVKWGTCTAQVIFTYVAGLNILDMIFYCRVFAFMRK